MNGAVSLPAAHPRAMPPVPGATLGRQLRVGRQPSTRGVDPGLIFVIVALLLGLAAVVASVAIEDGMGGPRQHQSDARTEHAASAVSSRRLGHNPRRPLAWSRETLPLAAFDDLPPPNSGSPPKSPLYPQNGVDLWDRTRVSSPRDRQAFLLGTAIQIHAPAVAAQPGWHD